jgi:hypothetical protein
VHQLADEWNLDNNVYEKSNGRIRHHIDFNKYNNDINSLDNYIRELMGTPVNHKVKKVKFLKKIQDVYDITTEP